MTMSVVIMPCLFVHVTGIPGSYSFHRGCNVMIHESRFIFQGSQCSCGTVYKKCCLPGRHTRFSYCVVDLAGHINDMIVALSEVFERVVLNNHGLLSHSGFISSSWSYSQPTARLANEQYPVGRR